MRFIAESSSGVEDQGDDRARSYLIALAEDEFSVTVPPERVQKPMTALRLGAREAWCRAGGWPGIDERGRSSRAASSKAAW